MYKDCSQVLADLKLMDDAKTPITAALKHMAVSSSEVGQLIKEVLSDPESAVATRNKILAQTLSGLLNDARTALQNAKTATAEARTAIDNVFKSFLEGKS